MKEAESEAVHRLLVGNLAATARHTAIEIASALARRCREGSLAAEDRDRALEALHQDLQSFLIVEVTPPVSQRCIELLNRHPLRAADALHLASCLELEKELRMPFVFVAYDLRLNAAAKKEGLELGV